MPVFIPASPIAAPGNAAILLILALLYGSTPASGQLVMADRQPRLAHDFQEGLAAYAAGETEAASAHLASVVGEDPAYYSSAHGSAAYWWGRALSATGDEERAHRAWSAGLGALDLHGLLDPRLTDAYIESVFGAARIPEYARAADAYLRLMERAQEFNGSEESCIIARHIAQLFPLLSRPDAERMVTEARADDCYGWRLGENAGAFIVGWWHAQDPLLATDRNERLELHLQRVIHAQQRLPDERRVSRIDDRGETFVRFGQPARTRSLRQNDNPLSRRADVAAEADDWSGRSGPAARSVPSAGPGNAIVVLPAGMPRGELWMYDHVDPSAYYVFIKEGRHFRLGQLTDMVPRRLLTPYGFRGTRNSGLAVNMLFGSRVELGLYEQLYFEHPDFAAALMRFENAQARDNNEAGGFTTLWSELRSDEEAAAAERDRRMPDHYSDLLRDAEPLPMSVYSARFLERDGTTRTEIYWEIDSTENTLKRRVRSQKGREGGEPRQSHVQLTVLQRDKNYHPRSRTAYEYEYGRGAPSLPAQTTIVRGDTGIYHVALQWEQNSLRTEPDRDGADAFRHRRQIATTRLDSVRALAPDPNVLEMSDVVRVAAEESSFGTDDDELPGFRPIPSPVIGAGDQPALYFEVYHLTTGPEGKATYTIEYEVARRVSGGILGLFRKRKALTGAGTASTSASPTARNTILLDLEEDQPGHVEVTVRVTDSQTKQQMSRSIAFEIQ